MVGRYDQGAGLLEKLQLLSARKVQQLLPEGGEAIGSYYGGPIGGYAGRKIGGGIQAIINAGFGGVPQDDYGSLGMSPDEIGLQTMSQPGMLEQLMGSGAQGLGQMAGEGASYGIGRGMGALADLIEKKFGKKGIVPTEQESESSVNPSELLGKSRQQEYEKLLGGVSDRFGLLEKLLEGASPLERETLLKKFIGK